MHGWWWGCEARVRGEAGARDSVGLFGFAGFAQAAPPPMPAGALLVSDIEPPPMPGGALLLSDVEGAMHSPVPVVSPAAAAMPTGALSVSDVEWALRAQQHRPVRP